MKFIKNNLIVIFLGLCLLFSMLYLSTVEVAQRDLDQDKNWWSVYFENPKDGSLDFFIENHGDSNDFTWEVYLEKNRIFEQKVSISKGDKKKLTVSSNNLDDKRVLIKISDGLKNKELYKIISK